MTTEQIDSMEDAEQYNFRQLMDTLYEAKDIIVTIPEEQEQELRDGLQDRKSKDNVVLKRKGVLPITDTLVFTVYASTNAKKEVVEGQKCVRIKLVPRRSVDIIRMEIPSDDL